MVVLETIWSLVGVVFVLVLIYFFVKSMAWSPVIFEGLGHIRKDPQQTAETRQLATVLWVLAGIWYALSVLIFFFTGLWILLGVLESVRDWWHKDNQ